VRTLRCELLAEHLGQDTSALEGRAALQVFRAVARENAGRQRGGNADWEGIACELDPLQWWAG
jgi:cardiolipin synthase